MYIEIWLHRLSQPIKLECNSTYQKGDFFCAEGSFDGIRKAYKYPIKDIFRIVETYNSAKSDKPKGGQWVSLDGCEASWVENK